MIHNSYLFNFQDIINFIREKVKEGKDMPCQSLLDAITEDTELEDLPMYKEYLSKFDVKRDLEGFDLKIPSELGDYKADFLYLLRFVAASFSSSYELELDEHSNSVILFLTAVSNGTRITKDIQELWSFQVRLLFKIYVEEILNLEALRSKSEDEKEDVDEQRNMKLMIYEKKIKQLQNRFRNEQERDEIKASLDDLLNS